VNAGFKHSFVSAFAAILGGYLGTKVHGVDPLAATAVFAGLLSSLFHVPISNDTLNTPPPGTD